MLVVRTLRICAPLLTTIDAVSSYGNFRVRTPPRTRAHFSVLYTVNTARLVH